MPRVREQTAPSTTDRSAHHSGTRPRTRPRAATNRITELETRLIDLVRRRRADTYELLVLIGEFDRHGYWALRGALSCAAWLARLCDIETGTARTQVRVARAMLEHPALDAAMANNTLSYAKARTLAAHLTEDNASALLGIATTTPANDLGAAIAAWSLRNENQDIIDARQRHERSLSWRVTPDGMVTFTIKLPPEDAARLQTLIDTETMRHNPAADCDGLHDDTGKPDDTPDDGNTTRGDTTDLDDATRTDTAGPADASADALAGVSRIRHRQRHTTGIPTRPSLAQQRADAFTRIIENRSTSPGTPPGTTNGPTPEIVIHVRPDGNTLTDGTPLSDNAVARMLPESFISLLIHDNERHPIDASPRRKYPTRRQRRVTDERHPQCTHPGCTARRFLQYDHIQPRHQDGPTVIDNLQRLCGPHNRAKNPGPGRPPDPERRPERTVGGAGGPQRSGSTARIQSNSGPAEK